MRLTHVAYSLTTTPAEWANEQPDDVVTVNCVYPALVVVMLDTGSTSSVFAPSHIEMFWIALDVHPLAWEGIVAESGSGFNTNEVAPANTAVFNVVRAAVAIRY